MWLPMVAAAAVTGCGGPQFRLSGNGPRCPHSPAHHPLPPLPLTRAPAPCSLSILLQALTAADPLPPVQPGALPQLTNFTMMLIKQARPIPLPASWGRPDVLLSLRELYVTATVALPLPANWARGFPGSKRCSCNQTPDPLHHKLQLV